MSFDLYALPTPDLGLRCLQCGYPLGGLSAHRCSECGLAINYESYIPKGDFPLLIVDGKEAVLTPETEDILTRLKIPFIRIEDTTSNIYGLHTVPQGKSRIGVARSHYFDAIDALRRFSENVDNLPPMIDASDWTCAACNEENPGAFEICWKCEQPRPVVTPND